MSKLNKYEKDLLKSLDDGNWNELEDASSVKEHHIAYAQEQLKKDKQINIRISSRDLELIQKKANSEGIPYQTLISSLIHKYVSEG